MFCKFVQNTYMPKKRYFKILIRQSFEEDPEGWSSQFVPIAGDHPGHVLSIARLRFPGPHFIPDPDHIVSILSTEFFELKKSLLKSLNEFESEEKSVLGDKFYRFMTKENNGHNALFVAIRASDPGSAILAAQSYYSQPSNRYFLLDSIVSISFEEYVSLCQKGYYFPI